MRDTVERSRCWPRPLATVARLWFVDAADYLTGDEVDNVRQIRPGADVALACRGGDAAHRGCSFSASGRVHSAIDVAGLREWHDTTITWANDSELETIPPHALDCTRASTKVPAAMRLAARAKAHVGETAVHTVPTSALETNFVTPFTVPSAP